jgi:hypothetical protein
MKEAGSHGMLRGMLLLHQCVARFTNSMSVDPIPAQVTARFRVATESMVSQPWEPI